MAFSPDGKTILTGSFDGMARRWDALTGLPIGQPLSHQGGIAPLVYGPDGKWPHSQGVLAVAFSPDGRTVLTGSNDKTARLWDAATGLPIGEPLVHQSLVSAVAFSPDGKTIVTGCSDGMARLWDAITHRPIGQPLVHRRRLLAVAFSPDGKTVLTGSQDRTARLWDAATGLPIGEPMYHPRLGHVRGVQPRRQDRRHRQRAHTRRRCP